MPSSSSGPRRLATPPAEPVILFDGVCRLCHFWSRFIIEHDHARYFKLATVQSPQGLALLAHFGLPVDRFDTMLYVEDGRGYTKSDAFFRVVAHLDAPWKWLRFFIYVPRGLRNFLYDRVAKNRYWIFGKYDSCLLPTPDHNARFLGGG